MEGEGGGNVDPTVLPVFPLQTLPREPHTQHLLRTHRFAQPTSWPDRAKSWPNQIIFSLPTCTTTQYLLKTAQPSQIVWAMGALMCRIYCKGIKDVKLYYYLGLYIKETFKMELDDYYFTNLNECRNLRRKSSCKYVERGGWCKAI